MYEYAKIRPQLFTEEGSITFMQVRDRVRHLLKKAGAVCSGAAMRGVCGDTWLILACFDRLIELGELRELTDPDRVAGQHRVFVKGHAG